MYLCRLVYLSRLFHLKSRAFDAAELPAFLKTGADAGYLLSVGAKQPREKSLNLAGVTRRYSSPITTLAHK